MTLNASGPISLAGTTSGQSIEIELGGNGTTQISLNCSSVRTLAGVPSGAITMPTNFYGKANRVVSNITISSDTTNYVFNKCKVTGYVAGKTCATLTINSGVYISANSTGTPALCIPNTWTSGDVVKIVNRGFISGMGGNGGGGGGSTSNGSSGASGGTALKVAFATSVCNSGGTISGGGGGGGGGGGAYVHSYVCGDFSGGGGGGGRTGRTNSSGGSGNATGGSGTVSSAGGGGAGGSGGFCSNGIGYSATAGNGGSGGNWGATGSGGGNGSASLGPNPGSCGAFSGGGGGGGGKATCGAGTYITWTAVGTRNGSVS